MVQRDLETIDYAARRRAFLKKIKHGVAVFPAAREFPRNAGVLHPFRQESNFYYLTGHHEPHSYCLLACESEEAFSLFVPPKDPHQELWQGKILGPTAAKHRYQADAAYPSQPDKHFDDAFSAAVRKADVLYYRFGDDHEFDRRILRLMENALSGMRRSNRGLLPIHDPDDILSEMRLLKTRAEIARLQIACNITAEAHVEAMKLTRPGMFEYEIEALVDHSFRARGSKRAGYGSIVAGGANACTLHYESNDQLLHHGDLLLIDAGAEFDFYTADVTRTFPVGREFTEPQRRVYEAVLRAQKECIAEVRPGKTLLALHEHAIEVLIEALRKLQILKGTAAQIRRSQSFREFYPHGTSHWLGMDVHDVGRYYEDKYGVERKLQPGHVFTIEPGLYFGAASSAPSHYKGIGVRIEDDILVTAEGCKVLTSAVPKEVDEIEALRASF